MSVLFLMLTNKIVDIGAMKIRVFLGKVIYRIPRESEPLGLYLRNTIIRPLFNKENQSTELYLNLLKEIRLSSTTLSSSFPESKKHPL